MRRQSEETEVSPSISSVLRVCSCLLGKGGGQGLLFWKGKVA